MAFDGNGPGSTAVVTCDPGLFADNGDQNMTVTCRSTGQWSYPNPGCSSWFKVFVPNTISLIVILTNNFLKMFKSCKDNYNFDDLKNKIKN